ncbi:MAG: HAD-IB family phosphatase, partial [Devosia sp.]|nr:HAD-IB family phosphatase [Devosia sp.]
MDSTMIDQECIDELADAVGIKDEVAAITARAMNGELDFEAALRTRVKLLKGLKVSRMEEVRRERITFAPGGRALVQTMKTHGAFTSLVSGGFTYFADYIGKRVTDGQSAKGRDNAGEWAQTLAAVEARYGVQGEILLAIWGIETNFGGYMGGTNTVHALATLTHGGYRADYFRGDGHKDSWGSVPDALASAGNYLGGFGWRAGETWGYEVKLPRNFDYRHVWSATSASLKDWAASGVARANGRTFPRDSDTA